MRITVITADETREHTLKSGGLMDELLLELGYIIERQCAGNGTCGRCRVKASGQLAGATAAEIKSLGENGMSEGRRLACQTEVLGDVKITLPAETPHTDKIFGKIPKKEDLPERLGLAIDLGTTTVGVFIVDLEHGNVLAANAVLNRQSSFGADIIHRLETAKKDPAPPAAAAIESIVAALEGLSGSNNLISGFEKATVVGNTAMHHLLLGLDISRLMVIPFQPTEQGPIIKKDFIKALGDNLEIRFPPLIGGFVGSDALACVQYFGLGKSGAGPALVVDLGTNGEVILEVEGRLLASSTAAGPAFEGVNISCGMRATKGAVVSARWEGEDLVLESIGSVEPKGLAGSGLLSVTRRLKEKGIVELSGRIINIDADPTGLVFQGEGGKAVRIGAGLNITQGDIRELQKAKGAVRACADTLMSMAGIVAGDIKRIYLTGSFGGRIDVDDVLSLGVLPSVKASVIRSIPNGAGLGAALMLDDKEFDLACRTAEKIEHVELFSDTEFMDKYIDAMALK